MLEELINLKLAIRKHKPKSEVKEKFRAYTNKYDNAEKTIQDKIRHREIFYSYINYMKGGK